MVDLNQSFQENVRNSFSNVKNDIFLLEKKLKEIEKTLITQNNDFLAFNTKLEQLNHELNKIKSILSDLKISSTGNNGVINNHQQSTINNHQQSTIINKEQQITQNDLKKLEKDFSELFKNLTDREFSVFMAICEQEKQQGETNYTHIANLLNLTETTVRAAVNRLIAKNIPLKKERLFNAKTSLPIKKDFHDLNLLHKLIRLRQNPTDQRTLFD